MSNLELTLESIYFLNVDLRGPLCTSPEHGLVYQKTYALEQSIPDSVALRSSFMVLNRIADRAPQSSAN